MSDGALGVALCVAGRAKTLAAEDPALRNHLLAVVQPLLATSDVEADIMLHLDSSAMHSREQLTRAAHSLGAASLWVALAQFHAIRLVANAGRLAFGSPRRGSPLRRKLNQAEA